MENQVVENGKVVFLQYILTNDAGDVLDRSEEGDPMFYLHGADNIVPGLETALTGRTMGDHVKVSVEPGDGYGERVGPGPQAVARSLFPKGLEIETGMQFVIEGPGGDPLPVWVTDVEKDMVFLDGNHPLAGQTLHFDVTVLSMRDATEEELAHGHPHGASGLSPDDDDEEFDDEEYDEDDEDEDEDFDDEDEDEDEDFEDEDEDFDDEDDDEGEDDEDDDESEDEEDDEDEDERPGGKKPN